MHSSSQSWDHFNRLCAGEKLIAPEQEKEFKCYFLKHNDPFVRLGPFKLDVQHSKPFVAVFRDFMYDAEMEHYKVIYTLPQPKVTFVIPRPMPGTSSTDQVCKPRSPQ